jgi:ADP-heptose:LPS heptosyltransferase
VTDLVIKSFNGIGDLLFVTPTLRVVKETYPLLKITVNTNFPTLVQRNPFVSHVGVKDEGLFLGYPDPIHQVLPTEHHIMSDWRIVTKHYGLETPEPALEPEIYLRGGRNGKQRVTGLGIGVQKMEDCKPNWNCKRIWPYLNDLLKEVAMCGHEIRQVPHFSAITELVSFIASLRLLVCTQGGLQQIAKAVGTPALVIYGGFAKPEWNGYADQNNLCNPKPCSYCWHPHPCVAENKLECLTEITLEQVKQEIERMLC